MHEMAITQSILNIAIREGQKAGAKRITALKIKMGEYSDIVPVILREYFAVAAKGTLAEGAVLQLERVPVTVRCLGCGWEGPIDRMHLQCPACGGIELKLLTGREFYVESLEAE